MHNTDLDLTSAPIYFTFSLFSFSKLLVLAPCIPCLSLQQMALVRGGQVTDDPAPPLRAFWALLCPASSATNLRSQCFEHLQPFLLLVAPSNTSLLPSVVLASPPLPSHLSTHLWAVSHGSATLLPLLPSGASLLDRADGKRGPGGDVL